METEPINERDMDVSIILSTWDNSARLRRTLEALTCCQVDDALTWELVLINNNCTDDTDAVAAAFSERLPLVYDHEPTPGLSHGRNAGLARASGQLVMFTDDDVEPAPAWIGAYWRAFQVRPTGYFFGGPVESCFEDGPPPAALLRIAPPSIAGLNFGDEAMVLDGRAPFIAANWACTREMLREAGDFDPKLGLNQSETVHVGEESDLMGRLRDKGLQPWYIPEARLQHMVPAEKCTHAHIVGRRIAQSRNEALTRYGAVRPRRLAAARAAARAGWLWLRSKIAPLLGRTGLLSHAKYRGYREAARVLVHRQ